ncbi:MAG: hypothetical protein COZ06_30380 [Armatimonadetes bacterium CG_4_10_14_3_um_filter_66_18]|nr:hypothetical protein [Armatimonadota bacterium]OIP07951.1 MAG: hypothetical protein AUJ96_06620 [Armatimonadetes bacterium CG2_30_66_41]PIU92918.1 MAG: hypothetical protein COS65_15510 [Armatimonadetes bacterium CG06_land_8_20_14_3_00_66_21]PIX39115.1 MAG: hypothetical protein COZ57_28850 [Armatimonadetes bacterium CG_4_8_14_3_um_filter_66_20]PIY39028.1 MAG: hypothetical protein COZ06_30380 [Armatimonadetes bacterium CG_4_10_14_3_um_filter_66_18]PIZ42974.1 MAG: hypothetical protein COY42_16
MEYLADNTVLSNLAAVGRLDLLRQLLGRAHVAEEVRLEVWAGIEAGYEFQRDTLSATTGKDPWLLVASMAEEERLVADQLMGALHHGECASIAICARRHWTFLTDDWLARRRAEECGVKVSGSVGVLRLGAELGLLEASEADALLAQMIAAGYRAPVDTISELLGETARTDEATV